MVPKLKLKSYNQSKSIKLIPFDNGDDWGCRDDEIILLIMQFESEVSKMQTFHNNVKQAIAKGNKTKLGYFKQKDLNEIIKLFTN